MPITLHAKDEPVIYTKYLPNAKIENCYNVSLQATGYPTWYAVITWSYEGELPDRLTFNNGSIYGEVKDSAVTKTFRVFASNDCGIDSRDITIKVVKNDMKIDFNFREASVTGGTAPYTWDYIYLPGGMSFTSSDSKSKG